MKLILIIGICILFLASGCADEPLASVSDLTYDELIHCYEEAETYLGGCLDWIENDGLEGRHCNLRCPYMEKTDFLKIIVEKGGNLEITHYEVNYT